MTSLSLRKPYDSTGNISEMIVKEINLTSIERQDPNSERQRLIDRPETRRTGDRDSVMTVMGGVGGRATSRDRALQGMVCGAVG